MTKADKRNGKTPLVLLPGLLCDAALFRHQVATLAGQAAPMVADLSQDEDIGAMARRVLERAPERFALAGLSMGGYVAFEIMRRAPERVERLALLDTSARPETPEATEHRRTLMRLAENDHFNQVPAVLIPKLIHPRRLKDSNTTDMIMAMAERIGPQGFVRQQKAIIARPDSRPDLGRISCPTLVLGGAQDERTPPDVLAEMRDAIPSAKLVLIEDCGHLSPIEQPYAVSAVLSYWLQL